MEYGYSNFKLCVGCAIKLSAVGYIYSPLKFVRNIIAELMLAVNAKSCGDIVVVIPQQI